jgi:hypothetical protein
MNIEDKIITKKRFCDMVESYVFEKRQSYMDAVIDIMTQNHIEPERVGVLINTSIKDKLEVEARNLNFLERINTLPL